MPAAVAVLDGGLGTSLQDKYGVVFDASTPLWASHLLVSDRATLLACQRDFASAGIAVLLTATYQVSVEGFARTKTPDFPHGIPRAAIAPFLRTALDVASAAGSTRRTEIALSLGPYGACMIPSQEYSGKYDAAHDSEEALYHWHRDRLQLFVDADDQLADRVQYIAFETLPRLDEVRAVRRAIHALRLTSTPFWISCVFPGEAGDDALPDGSSVEQVVTAAMAPMQDGANPWGIGINCTKIVKLPGLVERLGCCMRKTVTTTSGQLPTTLVLYPDGTNGEVYNTTTQQWEKKKDQGDGADAVGERKCSRNARQCVLTLGDGRIRGKSNWLRWCVMPTHEAHFSPSSSAGVARLRMRISGGCMGSLTVQKFNESV
ncbi:hypothetical protein UA08_03610 [Talaromyces atroroseus]|uniref:Hcy-binding domain-containing protein n=1 Tax=Talaromyces atroroseus TaxID=1441469 RepID=A0A225B442_TALAT|nr:hypothetical protein UA08_03610 [Talaromyces atroroseus]OKL61615.1 hypothetical protein UA08_03610 [Talaromyces atroroseus]